MHAGTDQSAVIDRKDSVDEAAAEEEGGVEAEAEVALTDLENGNSTDIVAAKKRKNREHVTRQKGQAKFFRE